MMNFDWIVDRFPLLFTGKLININILQRERVMQDEILFVSSGFFDARTTDFQ